MVLLHRRAYIMKAAAGQPLLNPARSGLRQLCQLLHGHLTLVAAYKEAIGKALVCQSTDHSGPVSQHRGRELPAAVLRPSWTPGGWFSSVFLVGHAAFSRLPPHLLNTTPTLMHQALCMCCSTLCRVEGLEGEAEHSGIAFNKCCMH